MEFPKMRFNQSLKPATEPKKIEKISNTVSKRKVKIKSIVPMNFSIKVLEGRKHILMKNQENRIDNSKNIVNKKQDNYNVDVGIDVNKNTSVFSSILMSDTFKPLAEDNSRKLNTVLKSDISNLEYNTENQNTQTKNVKKNDFSKIQNFNNKLKQIDVKGSQIKPVRSEQIKKRNTKYNNHVYIKDISTKFNEKNIPCTTCDENDIDCDKKFFQILNISTKPTDIKNIKDDKIIHDTNYIKSKFKNRFINEKKISNYNQLNKGKIFLKDNKENYSNTFKSNKEQNKLVAISTINILKDSTNATSQSYGNLNKEYNKSQKKIQHAKFKTVSSIDNIEKIVQTRVKKSTMFHILGNKHNISVQSTEISKNHNVNKNNDLVKVSDGKNTLYKDLLSDPEFNSTICVMKKLKEIETKKLIIDFEHLPQSYKTCLYEKVSTALDFAPYECVYKDLINLSLEDDKFPLTFMRSKDPEPKNKDIVPKLSDFYNPKYTEQYFVIVNPMASNPINMNTLSTFTISNKICIWKISMDN